MNYYLPWLRSLPLTKEQMEAEIASSLVASGDKQKEFSDADIHELLTSLNLTQRYTNDARDSTERA